MILLGGEEFTFSDVHGGREYGELRVAMETHTGTRSLREKSSRPLFVFEAGAPNELRAIVLCCAPV